MKLKTILTISGVVFLVVVIAAVVILKSMDFSQYKDLITDEVKKTTGREMKIKGEFELKISLTPALAVNDVSFANASWGSQPEMAKIKRLDVQLNLIPLLFGNVNIKRFVLIEPDILLETNSKGEGNWVLTTGKKKAPAKEAPASEEKKTTLLPVVNEMLIKDAHLTYRDGKTKKTVNISLKFLKAHAKDLQSPLKLDVEGAYNNNRVEVAAELGAISQLLKSTAPYPINLEVNAFGAAVKAKGTIKEPLKAKGFDLSISVNGKELTDLIKVADLPQLAGKDIPKAGPYDITAHIKEAAGKISVSDINVSVGKQDLLLISANGAIQDVVKVKGINLTVSAKGGELKSLIELADLPQLEGKDIPKAGPFDISAQIQGTSKAISVSKINVSFGRKDLALIKVTGAVKNALKAKGLDLNLHLEGPDLSQLTAIADVQQPLKGPFKIATRITDPNNTYTLKKLQVDFGPNNLKGNVSVDLNGKRPSINASFNPLYLDLSQLGPAEKKEKAKAGKSGKKSDRVFSSEPFPLEGLQAADATIIITNGTIFSNDIKIKNLELDMILKNGNLSIKPVKADILDGSIMANLSLKTRGKDTADIKTDLTVKKINIAKFLKDKKITDLVSRGNLDVKADIKGSGKSLRTLMAGLDGNVSVIMGKGRIENKYIDFLASDLMKLLIPGGAKKEFTMVNCYVTRFNIKNGMADSRGILLDTDNITVAGSGNINLADEKLNLTFNPKPKEASLVSLAVPLNVRGTFLNPSFALDTTAVAKKVIGGILGNAILPGAGLLVPLVSKGSDDKNPCIAALSRKRPPPPSTTKTSVQPKQEERKSMEKQLLEGLGKSLGGFFK